MLGRRAKDAWIIRFTHLTVAVCSHKCIEGREAPSSMIARKVRPHLYDPCDPCPGIDGKEMVGYHS